MQATGYTKETIKNIDLKERNFPNFDVGDAIAVSQKVMEGDKERIQIFEGDVIAIKHNGLSSTFTVRKIGANSVAVEKIFPYYSPLVAEIKFVRKGKVRRAKLYYMRNRVGKAARVQERVYTKEEKQAMKAKAANHEAPHQDGQAKEVTP